MAKYNCPVCKAPSTKETGCWKHSSKKPLKKSTLKKKPKTQEEKDENKKEIEKQWQFFLSIWETRPHKCQITGKWLGDTPYSWMFDHLIEKSKRADLKYEEDNIVLCTFDVHSLKTNGFPLPLHQELIEKAKQRFEL